MGVVGGVCRGRWGATQGAEFGASIRQGEERRIKTKTAWEMPAVLEGLGAGARAHGAAQRQAHTRQQNTCACDPTNNWARRAEGIPLGLGRAGVEEKLRALAHLPSPPRASVLFGCGLK